MRITLRYRAIVGPLSIATALLAIISFAPISETPTTARPIPVDATSAAAATNSIHAAQQDPKPANSSDPSTATGVSAMPAGPTIDAAVADEIAQSGTSTAVITLRTSSNGDDTARRSANTADYEDLLASFPAGSFTELIAPTTVPVATMRIGAAALETLRRSTSVAAVEANMLLRTSSTASSTVVGTQRAVASGWSGAGESVAIVDTGVNSAHPHLMNGAVSKTIGEACFSSTTSVSLSSCPGGTPMNVNDASRAGGRRWADIGVQFPRLDTGHRRCSGLVRLEVFKI